MKENLTYKILDNIAGFIGNVGDLVEAFFNAGYGVSVGGIRYEYTKLKKKRDYFAVEREEEEDSVRKMKSLIYKLKSCGFIKSEKNGDSQKWNLTDVGMGKLLKMRANIANGIFPSIFYEKEKSAQTIIIAFDIPERDRRKRDWFRAVISNLDCKMLQKSVWIGKLKVPEKLLADLKDLRILDFVQIFSINKSGSLEQVI